MLRRGYGPKSDIWSVGAIMAECYLRTVFLRGDHDIEQFRTIVSVFGFPSVEYMHQVPHNVVEYVRRMIPVAHLRPLSEMLPTAGENALQLMSMVFQYGAVTHPHWSRAIRSRHILHRHRCPPVGC